MLGALHWMKNRDARGWSLTWRNLMRLGSKMYVTCCNISRECLINLSAVAAASAAAASCSNDLASSHFPITIYMSTHTHTGWLLWLIPFSDYFRCIFFSPVLCVSVWLFCFCSFDTALACLAQCILAKAISCPSMCVYNPHIALCHAHTHTCTQMHEHATPIDILCSEILRKKQYLRLGRVYACNFRCCFFLLRLLIRSKCACIALITLCTVFFSSHSCV